MSRSPAFAIASALTLAIGIGLTTAISSIVDAVLVRPLPLPDSDRLVLVRESELPRTMLPTSYPEYLEWRSRATTLAGLAAASFNPQAMVPTREGTARLSAAMISTNYFDVVGARAALGRVISESDGGGLDVAVLSHDAWQTYFRSDPNAVGSALEVRGNLSGPSNLARDRTNAADS